MSKPIDLPSRIILTGFSGSGKSLVAPLIAQRLGWRLIDTDQLVEQAAAKSILDIFRDDGEQRFRDLEADALREACSQENVVISTGGGVVLRPENRRRMAGGGFIVCLQARPETVLHRLQHRGEEEPLDRPLLAVADPLSRIRDLQAARQHLYALCDWAIHTDSLTAEEIAEEVIRVWERLGEKALGDPNRLEGITAPYAVSPPGTLHAIPPDAACVVHTSSTSYPAYVSWGGLADLGQRLRQAGLHRQAPSAGSGQAFLISDDAVFAHYGSHVESALESAEIPAASYVVPAGEASKSLETAAAIYDWLVDQRAERGHSVIALGGGMITDLAGYVAATYARGLPLVHVPTSLLAMVDAAIGGKVAVNHQQAKNLIGAFYQPRLVLADVSTLRTLPPRELASGWAEVIKHALIADQGLLALLETKAEAVQALEPQVATEVIRRSIAIKAAAVSEDEREESGRRTVLNYGHTVGHALEAATDYALLLHGEAVAIGMTAAAEISRRLGLLSPEVVERQERLLKRFGLPTRAPAIERLRQRRTRLWRERVLAAMALDKKVRGGAVRWVLLEGIGRPVLRDDVPPSLVDEALDQVLETQR